MNEDVAAVDEIQQMFIQMDTNKDSYISEDELKTLSKTFSECLHDEDILRLMEEADLNGDGLIDLQVYTSVLS